MKLEEGIELLKGLALGAVMIYLGVQVLTRIIPEPEADYYPHEWEDVR